MTDIEALGRRVAEACRSYRQGQIVCADGFIQKSICAGHAGCLMCGNHSASTVPNCENEDIPARWLTEAGAPLFYPALSSIRPNGGAEE